MLLEICLQNSARGLLKSRKQNKKNHLNIDYDNINGHPGMYLGEHGLNQENHQKNKILQAKRFKGSIQCIV